MKMTFRWFGTGFDSISLWQIRQIPGVKGVITTLYDSVPGEAWDVNKSARSKKKYRTQDLKFRALKA